MSEELPADFWDPSPADVSPLEQLPRFQELKQLFPGRIVRIITADAEELLEPDNDEHDSA